ncbi:MAG: UDP-N-acetylmuramoyl-L-alanine--D-glutamate ligase [Lentisphaeria bacterium]|nr:UDP-N-acetylmuramoyl-L-alanine--D-glutamate ligase [Lentisphaeria bacterium]
MELVIIGGGVSGRAAEKLGKKLGYTCTVVEDKTCSVLPPADLIVASPGVFPARSSLYQQALSSGVELIGEMEFAFRHFHGRILAITGTNGKTTTTELTTHLLNAMGHTALFAGNIGRPLSELAAEAYSDTAVVEVSSFQLELAPAFAPFAAALLNLESDHEDRYPGGFEEYCAVKRRIFRRTPEENRILGLSFADAPRRITVREDHLCLDGEKFLDLRTTRLGAPHNRENLAAAAELVLRVITKEELLSERFIRAVQQFSPGRHRIEQVTEKNGILFVNDSKGTNPAAVLAAVRSIGRKCVIMLGGLDKGMDFTPLAALVPHLSGAVLYGESAGKIRTVLEGKIPLAACGSDFEAAFAAAVKMAQPGECVLLSPACASMDMFKNYQERGDRFCQLAQSL